MESKLELPSMWNQQVWLDDGGRGERSRGVAARGDSPVPCHLWMYIQGKHRSGGTGLVHDPSSVQAGRASRGVQRSRESSPESIPAPGAPARGSADAPRAVRHLAGPRGLRNKELLAELSAAPGRSLTCRYRAVAQAGLSQRVGDPPASHGGI